MSYPEKILADDEEVVAQLHPHWITLVPATLWFIVLCGLAGVGIAFAPDHGTAREAAIIAILVVGVILLVYLSVRPWIGWRSTHYILTSHRVLIRRGVLRHTGRDIPLQRINDVSFTQSLFDRMVGAGTLVIESAGEQGQETLTNIPHSDEQQQLLNRLVEQDSERRARQAYQEGYPQQSYPQQSYPQQSYPQQGPPPGYQPTREYPPQ